MKALRTMSLGYTNFLALLSEWTAGQNTLSYIIGAALTFGSVFLAFTLISRVNVYNEDSLEESFAEAKNAKRLAGWANGFMGLWLFLSFVNIIYTYQFGRVRVFLLILGLAGYVFSWYSLKKFSDANRRHSIDIAKENKGDPSIVMSESFGLSRAQKDAVSMIVGNAGASRALSNPKTDEELFGTIDDPVYDDPHTPRIVCRLCGKVNHPKHSICAYCGAALDKANTAIPSNVQSEIDKILNGTKKTDAEEDPVQRILKSAGVIQTDDGKYISVKKSAGSDIKIVPTTEEKPDRDITVEPSTEGITEPSKIEGSLSVTELKGTDFYSNG